MIQAKVAVASRTFSRHPILREEMRARFANVTFNEEGLALKGDQLVSFLRGHAGAILALEKLDADCISKLPELKVVSKYGVGLDGLDLDALKAAGKSLAWQGGVNRRSVAELALVFMMGAHRNVLFSTRQMAGGEWKNAGGSDLTGKTVGIIGCGAIGSELVKLLQPFRCRVLVNDLRDVSGVCREQVAAGYDVQLATKEQIYRESDVVTLHTPYSKENAGMIGAAELAQMKPTAVLVNTSRGGIVDEDALLNALQSRKILAAAMDVFAVEPAAGPDGVSPLLKLDNFFGTPHIGGSSQEAILAMGRAAIDGLERALSDRAYSSPFFSQQEAK